MNYNRNDTIFETKSVGHDLEEGPEWIKELNKLISTVDGLKFLKILKIKLI